MMNSLDLTSRLAIDSKSIDDLHLLSKQDSKKALQEAAKQFEALFLQMLIKSMRDATLKSGLIDSQQTQFYTEMYDQQLAQTMSSKGIGLADIMVEQLTRTYNTDQNPQQPKYVTEHGNADASLIRPGKTLDDRQDALATDQSTQLWPNNHVRTEIPVPENITAQQPTSSSDKSALLWPDAHSITDKTPKNTVSQPAFAASASGKTEHFINALMPHASNAAETTGIPAHFMLAQAALESGWGKFEIRHPDNSPSHNLFGIKAGTSWKGETVETITTEYINGVPQKMIEKFRAYGSYEEAFRDYANLLSNNPRYADVVNSQNAADFAHGLQRAGYATDPQYADKLLRILNNSILYNQEAI
ncbi:flagellar assembly peptidoglycan hydrolase FlgJ [Nitrosomonas sp.]|uniref:flagellar assembly peptidoglycan hydrolase FlgJ n=1 Tax=Nitrosomonas sp. TaxID=42353 RepID=UPI00283D07A8|nr:flagellar assembly peptidoglycan hydrolase FlgJ [Nitrosomonas sp.]MDR4515676.1 flagellar assembly peptidoglycan hydrolase FlgJ [Nitrosomonas sp.]